MFENAGIENFEKLPPIIEEKARFALLYRRLAGFINAARLQGFVWEVTTYPSKDEEGNDAPITVALDEKTFVALTLRYKELFGPGGSLTPDTPFDLDGSLTEIDTGKIDYEYMNSRFVKYIKVLDNGNFRGIYCCNIPLNCT